MNNDYGSKALVFFPEGHAFLLSAEPYEMIAGWKAGNPQVDADLTPEAQGAVEYIAIPMSQAEPFKKWLKEQKE
jgi:hypothetical protein